MFLKRSYKPEIMDDLTIRDYRVDRALYELKYVNKYLGGVSVTSSAIKKLIRKKVLPIGNKQISVLDIGAGASDILLKLKRNSYHLDITAIDINPRACFYLKNNSHLNKVVCADVHALPFKKQFSLIHASLFLHHFTEDQIAELIKSLHMMSKAIIINDLRRSVLAYTGITLLTMLFSKSRMVKNDGPLSVRRGFIKKDWSLIFAKAGVANYSISRKWAFRWLIIIY